MTQHRRRRLFRPLPLAAACALVATAAVTLPQLTPDASAATTLRGYADGRGVRIGAAVRDAPLTSDSAYTTVLDREFPSTFGGYGAALPYNESYAAKPACTGLSNGLNPAA